MSSHPLTGRLRAPGTRRAVGVVLAAGSLVVLIGTLAAPRATWANLLLVSQFAVGIGLGASFFIALQYVCGAHWATALRRVPEAMTAALPIGLAGTILVVILRPGLYPWTGMDAEHYLREGFRGLWLDRSFFLLRTAAYTALWLALTWRLLRNSRRQDADGDISRTRRNVRLSAAFMVIFAFTWCAATFDWIMSLEPAWYSTIFGVYNFAGMVASSLAVMILLVVWQAEAGPLRRVVKEDHLHDLAKLLLGFITFWAYIWFSQYMLIWYANFPEETGYFAHRQRGAWGPLLLVNFMLNWAVPFFALLPRRAKRNRRWLVKVAIVVLLGRWLDLYLMIMPPIIGEASLGLFEIGAAAGMAALLWLTIDWRMSNSSPIPLRDPGLATSLNYRQ